MHSANLPPSPDETLASPHFRWLWTIGVFVSLLSHCFGGMDCTDFVCLAEVQSHNRQESRLPLTCAAPTRKKEPWSNAPWISWDGKGRASDVAYGRRGFVVWTRRRGKRRDGLIDVAGRVTESERRVGGALPTSSKNWQTRYGQKTNGANVKKKKRDSQRGEGCVKAW